MKSTRPRDEALRDLCGATTEIDGMPDLRRGGPHPLNGCEAICGKRTGHGGSHSDVTLCVDWVDEDGSAP